MDKKIRIGLLLIGTLIFLMMSGCGRQAKLDAANAAVESMIGDLGSDIDNLEDIPEISQPGTPTTADDYESEEDPNKNSLEQPTTLSDELFSYQISIDGNIIQFPISYDDFTSLGFQPKVDNPGDVTLTSWGYDSFGSVTRNGVNYPYTIYNVDVNTLPMDKCLIGGIGVEAYYVQDIEVLLPGGLNIKDATIEDVKRMYGEPSSESSSDFPRLTYQEDVMNRYEFVFSEGKIFSVEIKNLIVPRGFKSGEVSKDVPEAVSNYKKPTSLTNNPTDFVVQIDKAYYQLPCPVSEFIKNGWEIKDIEEYDFVVAQGSGSLTFIKGDSVRMDADYVNYSDSATDIENCFVTRLSSSYKYEFILSGQIKEGDKETDVMKKLSDLKFDYREDGSEHSYTYRDESNFFTTIYFNFKDGILSSIQLQNKPEYEDFIGN